MFNNKFLAGLFAALFVALASPAFATCGSGSGTCFVVAGGGNSNATTTWTASSGGLTCTCTPASSDAVILDSAAGQLTLNASLAIASLDASGTGGSGSPYTGTLTHNTAVTLTINTGSLTFVAGMTYTPASTTSLVTFTSTSGTAVLTTGGKNFAAITVNGAGGTVQLADALNVTAVNNAVLTLTAGTLDAVTNTEPMTLTRFENGGSSTRVLSLGGNVTLGGKINANNNIWNTVATGLTFNKNSANIIIAAGSLANAFPIFAGAGLTYNNLTFNASTVQSGFSLTGSNTFGALTIGSGWNILPQGGTTQTVSSCAITGTAANPSSFIGSSSSGAITISTAGACTAIWSTLFNVTGAGGGSFTATNSFNGGITSGWTITPPSAGGGVIIGG